MEIVSKRVTVTGFTVRFDQEDLSNINELLNILHSATKQNAYGIVKDLAGDLQKLIDEIATTISGHKSSKKRPKDTNEEVDVANNELVKVSINNIDDNCVLQAAISVLGEFVDANAISVEAELKQNKGVYVTEEQLDKLLDKILAYNIKNPNTPLSITIGE